MWILPVFVLPGTQWHIQIFMMVFVLISIHCNYYHSTRVYLKTSWVCCWLFCYECAAGVTMPTVTNLIVIFYPVYLGTMVIFYYRTTDFIVCSDVACVTCNTCYGFLDDLNYWYRFSCDLCSKKYDVLSTACSYKASQLTSVHPWLDINMILVEKILPHCWLSIFLKCNILYMFRCNSIFQCPLWWEQRSISSG